MWVGMTLATRAKSKKHAKPVGTGIAHGGQVSWHGDCYTKSKNGASRQTALNAICGPKSGELALALAGAWKVRQRAPGAVKQRVQSGAVAGVGSVGGSVAGRSVCVGLAACTRSTSVLNTLTFAVLSPRSSRILSYSTPYIQAKL